MISIKVLSKTAEKFVLDNAPSILTGIGAVGSVGSVVLAVKASFPASRMIEAEAERLEMVTPTGHPIPELSKKDIVVLVWKEYIPAASLLTLSVTAIVFSNRVSTKRAAALAAAYTLSEKAYGEYREKVVEKFNANKERQVRDDIAQDRVAGNPPKDAQVVIIGTGDVVCYDQPSDRYFQSSMEKLRSAVNDINAAANEVGYATLSDFYVALKLKETPYSEELGWTPANQMDAHFSAILTEDAQPCLVINYHPVPIRHLTDPKGCAGDGTF